MQELVGNKPELQAKSSVINVKSLSDYVEATEGPGGTEKSLFTSASVSVYKYWDYMFAALTWLSKFSLQLYLQPQKCDYQLSLCAIPHN